MKPYKRSARVAGMIQKEISLILGSEMTDRGFGIVSITGVELTDDLAYATVFVSYLDSADNGKKPIEYLNSHKKRLRSQLARRVTLRSIPEISFKFDSSIDRGMRIETILQRLAQERSDSERQTD